jgi:hypothetical protein
MLEGASTAYTTLNALPRLSIPYRFQDCNGAQKTLLDTLGDFS